jgi:hypothetical protein
MPAVGPGGSQGGLIAAVVVFTVLFVTATIFAIYFGVDDSKKTEMLQTQTEKSKLIYSGPELSNPRYAALTNPPRPGQTVLQAAFADSQNLADVIAGKKPTFAKDPNLAAAEANLALKSAATKLPTLNITPSMDLVSVVNKLVAYAADQQYQNTALRAQQNQAAGDAAQQIALAQQLAQKAHDDAAAAVKEKDAALERAQAAESNYQAKVRQMSAAMDKERGQMNAELQRAETSMQAKDRELDQQKRLASALVDKLSGKRVSTVDPLLRQPDGTISSVATNDIVYIDLGEGDHIVPGMTFEVYSRREGIPKQEDLMSPENMPAGIASIEVQQVLSGVSQCRVIKTEIGQHIAEGDLIANLVYDRNTKYNLVVYGDFDLGQTGKPRPSDRQKIAALITQWGGKVQKDIDVDTDFVVMGAEPKVEQFTTDELNDPLNKQIQADEQASYNAYQAELEKAEKLGIPVMNQNRFLYFCGYYDNAQR